MRDQKAQSYYRCLQRTSISSHESRASIDSKRTKKSEIITYFDNNFIFWEGYFFTGENYFDFNLICFLFATKNILLPDITFYRPDLIRYIMFN